VARATTAASGDRSPKNGSSAKPSSPTGRSNGSGFSNGKRRRRTAARLFRFDRSLGARFVAGADEAGRGSLAGPLVAAAVLFDYERLDRRQVRALTQLDDSKVHDAEHREALFPLVLAAATRVAVTSRCARGIDERGLHKTNLRALRDCLAAVAPSSPETICLVDGFRVADLDHRQQAVIDGDARSAAIAAASVVAKVTRDRYMLRAAEELPGWHFHTNVGYSTPEHRDAIQELGISWLHRRSFQSVAYQQLAIES
jgi:ribonuclease HII